MSVVHVRYHHVWKEFHVVHPDGSTYFTSDAIDARDTAKRIAEEQHSRIEYSKSAWQALKEWERTHG